MPERFSSSAFLWAQGGLGNQLFQLNAGLELGSANAASLIVSKSSFGRDRLRDFELERVVSSANMATKSEERRAGQPYSFRGRKKRRARFGRMPWRFEGEVPPEVAFVPGSLNVGFYQSAQYLELPTSRTVELVRGAQNLSQAIIKTVAGSPVIHVRRGDYATSASARRSFGFLSRDYYESACSYLGISMSDCIVFTDDPDAVEREFELPSSQLIGPAQLPSSLDTVLAMSLATDLIMPNSTYSWWAAELGNPRHVIAPEIWFFDRDGGLQRPAWVRIQNQ